MEKFRELSFEESQEIDGGGIPLLLYGAYCLSAVMVGIAYDIISNFNHYSEKLDNKLANCK